MSNERIKVAVLMGGPSSEHEVSLKTGQNVINNLDQNRYSAEPVVIEKNGEWPLSVNILKEKTDVAFIAMHGEYGEDGGVQSFLDSLPVSYTGSGALTSALGMNKYLSLRHFQDYGLKTPNSILLSQLEWRINPNLAVKKIFWNLEKPWVLKPNRGGSSVGVKIVNNVEDLVISLHNSFMSSKDMIIQNFIKGREVTCAVLDHGFKRSAYALMPTEIVPLKSHFFDYVSKYDPKGSLEITPARLSEAWLQTIRRSAVHTHNVLECRGMSRADMIVGEDGNLYILEINTIPGLTENSLLPKAAAHQGISFPDLLHRIIQAAINR